MGENENAWNLIFILMKTKQGMKGRQDYKYDDIQYNDIHHNGLNWDTQMTLSIHLLLLCLVSSLLGS